MKSRWKWDINVLFPFIESQKWNCYFQNRIIMFCLPVPTLIYLWEIYIFPGSVCLFCCRKICGVILGIYKSLTDTWMWKLGLRSRNSQKRNSYLEFSLECMLQDSAAVVRLRYAFLRYLLGKGSHLCTVCSVSESRHLQLSKCWPAGPPHTNTHTVPTVL